MTQTYIIPEAVDDELGEGVRLYTNEDTVYEARTLDDTTIRIAGTADAWRAQVHLPASSDPSKGYDTFDTVAERLDAAYGTALRTPATSFLDRIEDRDTFETSDDSITVQYREEAAWKTEPGDGYSPDEIPHALRTIGAGAGAATGAALGASTGSPEAAAVMGVVGGVYGLVGGYVDGMGYLMGLPTPLSGGTEKGLDWTLRKKRERKKRRANRQELLEDADLFDRFNEKQRLDAVQDETYNTTEAARFRELRDSGIEERVEGLLERQFDRFDERQGVTAQYTADGYREAARFVTTVVDRDNRELERPSIFADGDVFRRLFEAADQTEQERLAAESMDVAGEDVRAYLNGHHSNIVSRVGQRQALEREDGG